MKQLLCERTGELRLAEVPTPQISDGDILLRMETCGICGTDIMKVYDPHVSKPVQLGHEIAGTIVAAGAGVQSFRPGMRVAAAHHAPNPDSHYSLRGSETQDPGFKASNVDPGGFAEYIRVPAALVAQTVHAVPDAMPLSRAAFMEPLACCIRALDRAALRAGDTLLIVGVGAIGLLFMPLARQAGAQIIAADINAERLRLARLWGAVEAVEAGAADLPQLCKDCSDGRGVDIVILTVTTPQTLTLALASVRDGGTIVPFGVKPGAHYPIDIWQTYRREINITASYSATPTGLARAMWLLSQPGFEFERTISHSLPLARAAEGFHLLQQGKASKVMITAESETIGAEQHRDGPAGKRQA